MRKLVQILMLPMIWVIGVLTGRCEEYMQIHSECMDGKPCPILRSIRQKLHLVLCYSCRRWVKQVEGIRKLLRDETENPEVLPEAELDEDAMDRIRRAVKKSTSES